MGSSFKRAGVYVALGQARYASAAELYQQALPIYRLIGDRLGEANCVSSLGDLALRQARYAEAAELYQQALPIYRQIGDRLGEANCLLSQGRLARATGNIDLMNQAFREAAQIYASIGLDDLAERAAREGLQELSRGEGKRK